jgi:hypothetical protein
MSNEDPGVTEEQLKRAQELRAGKTGHKSLKEQIDERAQEVIERSKKPESA